MKDKPYYIKHVVIVMFSTMGDVAMAVPAIKELRNTYPDLRISVLTKTFFHPFFKDIEGIGFVKYDPAGRHKGLGGLSLLAKDIRRAGVDAVADFGCNCKTFILRTFLLFSGIRMILVHKGREEQKNLIRSRSKACRSAVPAIERYADVLARLGFQLSLPDKAVRVIGPMPERIGVHSSEKAGIWIGVAPFARHEGKIYPIQLTDKLINLLCSRYDKVFIFGGGDHEQSFAEGMEMRYKNAVSVIGRVGLSAEMDVMSNMDTMVVMDSASMHMASMLGVPAVSIWGATHSCLGAYGFGQDPDDMIQLNLKCRPCSTQGKKPCIFRDYRCLADIAPETIIAAVERRLKKNKRASDQFLRQLNLFHGDNLTMQ